MSYPIQGQDAVLSFYKNAFLPFVCASDVSIEVDTAIEAVATVGDGHWDKNKYSSQSYTITLSGVLVFDPSNFTGWDVFENQLGFAEIPFRCSFTGQDGSIKSVQGNVLVSKTSLTASIGQVVRNDFSLIGDGLLMYFDGLIPCDSTIESITVTGNTGADGTIGVSYTYSGIPTQVKYRLNGTGAWSYSSIGTAISIPSLAVGNYTIEIIPICLNGYEGTGLIVSFAVTHALTCSVILSGLNAVVSGGNVTIGGDLNSEPAGVILKYTLNGGITWTNVPVTFIPFSFVISGLPIGSYTIQVVPVCANGVSGTGETTNFTIAASPAVSLINWTYTVMPPNSIFRIFKNGILIVAQTDTTSSGSFSAVTTDVIMSQLSSSEVGRSGTLQTEDSTTSTVINNQAFTVTSGTSSITYSFSPSSGHTYLIDAIVSP